MGVKKTQEMTSQDVVDEATKWSRVLETSILSDEMARIQCNILIRAGKNRYCVCAQCVLTLPAREEVDILTESEFIC